MFNHGLFTVVSGTYLSQLPGFVTAPTSKITSSPTASDCLLFHLHPSRVSWALLPQHSGTPDCCGCHRHLRKKELITVASYLGSIPYTKAAHLQQSWTLSMRRGSTQTLLKTSGMPQSILHFLKETFAQTHFEEWNPVPRQILNSLRKRILNLCQSRSTHLLSTCPLAAVSTVVASHPHISPTQVLHVPTTW